MRLGNAEPNKHKFIWFDIALTFHYICNLITDNINILKYKNQHEKIHYYRYPCDV